MYYKISEDLTCCDVDGHLVFLDIAQDRYFRLAHHLESEVRRSLASGSIPPQLCEQLAPRTTSADKDLGACVLARIQPASLSALELPPANAIVRLNVEIIIEVIVIVCWIHIRLRTRTLKSVINDAIAYKSKKRGRLEAMPTPENDVLHAALRFIHARRYVPIEPTCLLDSLALLRFLSRRGFSANLVFAVTPEPFAAHCWIQSGDAVLNETLSDANAHTPIRAI